VTLAAAGANALSGTGSFPTDGTAFPLYVCTTASGLWTGCARINPLLTVGKRIIAGSNISTVETATSITISGTGGGGGGTIAATTNILQGDGAGNAIAATGNKTLVGTFTAGPNGRITLQEGGAGGGGFQIKDSIGATISCEVRNNGIDDLWFCGNSPGSFGVAEWATGGLQFFPQVAQPTCNAAARGLTWYTASASGTKDRFEICAKAADDSYAWRTIY
jgi:hypothetical protein